MLFRIHWKYLSYWNKKCQGTNQETKPPTTHTGQMLLGSASGQIPSVQNWGMFQRVYIFPGSHLSRQCELAYNETSLLCYISLQQSYSLQHHLCELKNHVMFKGQSNMPSIKAKNDRVWGGPVRGDVSMLPHPSLLSPFYQPCSGWWWDDVKCGEGVLVYSGKVTG